MSADSVRLAIVGMMHESNSYVVTSTELEAFEVWRGMEIVRAFSGSQTYVGGMLAAADKLGAVVVPSYVAEAEPSGVITSEAYRVLREELLESLRTSLPFDGVAIALHGSAAADGTPDVEGDLCGAVRELVGPDTPIAASLDLHGNISPALVRVVDVAVGVKRYPHTDMHECGYQVLSLLSKVVAGQLRPVLWLERLPMIMPATSTDQGPLQAASALCEQLGRARGMVDVTLFHGFPYADAAHATCSVLATAATDGEMARACAIQVARFVWERREQLRPHTMTATTAVSRALAMKGDGPIIVNETSDNPGGGAPGDGTHLLRALVQARVDKACFGFLVDPQAVQRANDAGVGSTIEIGLGGKTDRLHGDPLHVTAYVKAITDGRFTLRDYIASQGPERDLGLMARLQVPGLDILVASRRSQTHDPEVFLLHGIDVRRYRIVALKSSNHFRAGFAKVSSKIVTADSPGVTTLRVERFERQHVPRPIWPLDKGVTYRPRSGSR